MAKKVSINKLLRTDDAFLTTSEKFFLYFKQNTRKIFTILGIMVALALVGFVVKSIHDSRAAKAMDAFHQANTIGEAEARGEALRAVRENYPGTKPARQAAYALLDDYMAAADLEEALPLLDELIRTVDSSEESIRPLLVTAQAGLLEQVGQLDLALESYKTALALVDRGQVTQPEEPFLAELYSSIGRVNLALGRPDEAKKAYADLIARAPNTYRSFTAQVRLSQLEDTDGEEATPDAGAEIAPAPEGGSEGAQADSEATPTESEAAPTEAEGTETDSEATPAEAEAAPAEGEAAGGQ
ncbi:MAG: tetratricopeptide repeat protein [Deltaproteobacteria bacterium]|jgi:tetratricopeptide (TPR) repeat protein|nr:tetratricopeptide repeat protein [Deltaproteobacteria bacterium]